MNFKRILVPLDGSPVAETVLPYIADLAKKMKAQFDAAIKADRLKPNEGMRLLQDYERGLKDQTYLSFGDQGSGL